MKTKVYFIENPKLPDIVAKMYLEYPAYKVFNNKSSWYNIVLN